MKKTTPAIIFSIVALTFLTGGKATDSAKTIIWKLQNTHLVSKYKPTILGHPLSITAALDTCLWFNGTTDGLLVPHNPIEGWTEFTIEVLFKPSDDGPVAPRFIHFEDKELNRGTFEVRLTANGKWYLDAFLKNGKTNKGLTLIDSTKSHYSSQWYWAAMVYDGKKMCSYVNSRKEADGEIDFPAMTTGNISFGVRLNKVNWFKGAIKEIRFHPKALDPSALQQY